MKKYIVPGIAIILFASGVYAALHRPVKTTPTETTNTPPVKQELLVDKSLSTDKTYSDPADKYTIFKVVYPQFTNASTEFNKKIEDAVMAGITEQKQNAGPNWKARYDTRVPGENITEFPSDADKFYFDTSWTATQENSKYISFVLTISAFEGGAHGYETLSSFNYDVVNKKEVALADLFPNDPNYLKTISAFSQKDLTAQFRTRLNVKTKDDEDNFQNTILPMMQDGTTPDLENFSVFTFTPDKIMIYFNQYQVAPYSMGQSTVVMPRK